jgi:hypothetical protein
MSIAQPSASDLDRRAREHFDALTYAEKVAAIYALADSGMTDYGIAHATKFAVEQVRAILAERVAEWR